MDVMLKPDSEPFLSKSQINSCDESFSKKTSEEVKAQKDIKGHCQPR